MKLDDERFYEIGFEAQIERSAKYKARGLSIFMGRIGLKVYSDFNVRDNIGLCVLKDRRLLVYGSPVMLTVSETDCK